MEGGCYLRGATDRPPRVACCFSASGTLPCTHAPRDNATWRRHRYLPVFGRGRGLSPANRSPGQAGLRLLRQLFCTRDCVMSCRDDGAPGVEVRGTRNYCAYYVGPQRKSKREMRPVDGARGMRAYVPCINNSLCRWAGRHVELSYGTLRWRVSQARLLLGTPGSMALGNPATPSKRIAERKSRSTDGPEIANGVLSTTHTPGASGRSGSFWCAGVLFCAHS